MRGALAAARMLPRLRDRRAAAPRDTTVLYDVAVAYALTQQFDSAREALTALQRVAPGSTRARALLASLPK
jgi:predicted Zn-dependent protease